MRKAANRMVEWPRVATFHDRRSAPDAVPWGRWRLVENMATVDDTWQLRCGWRRFGHWMTYPDEADLRVRPDESSGRLRSAYTHVDPSGKRRLFLASGSIYSQYNDGRWRTLLTGEDPEPFRFASVGTKVFATNNNGPVLYHELDTSSFSEVADLETIGLSRAGTIISWKGILFLADVVMDHVRVGHRIVWSDLENPLSFDPTTDSIAGFQDLDPGETILVGVPMGDSLYLFTTHSIWRVTVVGGEAYFSFQQVYHDRNGAGCLVARNALVVWKDTAIYLSRDGVQTFGSYSASPDQPAWMYHATAAIPTDYTYCKEITFAIRAQWGELWISYPYGDSEVASRTTVLNFDSQTSDEIDHGFSVMAPVVLNQEGELLEWARQTFGCSSDSLDALFPPAPGETRPTFSGTRKTIEEVCASIETLDCTVPCPSEELFLVVSAEDDALKSVEHDYFARQQYGDGGYEDRAYGARWVTGAVCFDSMDWKRISEVVLGLIPQASDDPRTVTLKVSVSGVSADVLSPDCNLRTFTLSPRTIECPAATSATLQPNAHFRWPLVAEGRYLHLDFVVSPEVGGPFSVTRLHAQFSKSPNSTR